MEETSKTSYCKYEKFLDWTLEKQVDEFKMFSLSIHDSHLSLIKNYLWLAAMVVGGDCSLLYYMDFSLRHLTSLQAIVGPCVILSTAISIKVFIDGTSLLLGEKGGAMPNMIDSYIETLQKAHGDDDSHKTIKAKSNLVERFEYRITYLRNITSAKAIKIRTLNQKLVISVWLGAFSAAFYYLFR